MTRYDPTAAEILVFTFKDGLLSAVAHDLKIRVTHFTLDVEGSSVKADIDPSSLRTICAVKDGADYPSGIPSIALSEVDRNMLGAVLDARNHRQIRFASTSITDHEISGELTLHGVTKTVHGVRRDTPRQLVGEFRFDQRDFGIKPFTAMLGTMKVKPEVLVRVAIPKS
jgi:polyisoprenoid-binding protein YceI